MTLLRHPVVITSLEEDFRMIGLISEERRDEDEEQSVDSGSEEPEDAEDVAEEESDEDEDAAMAEAVAFHEDFQVEWARMGEEGVETLHLDADDMEELEGFAEEVTELPLDVIGATLDEDESDDADEDAEIDEDDEDDVDEAVSPAEALEAVSQEMGAIRALLEADEPSTSLAEAIPAFANLALIAERLYGFFQGLGESEEDEGHLEISEAYADIAKKSAAMVKVLQTEDHDDLDAEAVGGAFQEYLKPVLKGLETYTLYREAGSQSEDDETADDETDDDEVDEGNE